VELDSTNRDTSLLSHLPAFPVKRKRNKAIAFQQKGLAAVMASKAWLRSLGPLAGALVASLNFGRFAGFSRRSDYRLKL